MKKTLIRPIEPILSDFPKREPFDETHLYVIAYRKYQHDIDNYYHDLEIYEQEKFIKDIKRSSEKLCLKKYKIVKR